MTLASFYARRKQWERMLQAVQAGVDADAKAAKPHGSALVEGAALLARNNQDPQLAIQLLKLYLDSPNKSADSPTFRRVQPRNWATCWSSRVTTRARGSKNRKPPPPWPMNTTRSRSEPVFRRRTHPRFFSAEGAN